MASLLAPLRRAVDDGPRLVLLGRQGAGKGTQAVRLADRYGVCHVATGDILRAAARAGTELGRKVKAHIDAGDLLPDDVIVGVVQERLAREAMGDQGFVLDGFPRTVGQASALIELSGPGGIDAAIHLDVPADEVLRRLDGRRVCRSCGAPYSTASPPSRNWTCEVCGGEVVQREDDAPEAVQRRLALYERDTAPALEWLDERGLLLSVDGRGEAEDVTERLVEAVDAVRLGRRPDRNGPRGS